MALPKHFNNIILGQYVLGKIPVQVYVSGRFLTLTDTDDVEDALIGFGMDENGDMIQFSYPEIEHIQIAGNRIDINTYNKGMAAMLAGDEAPADAEAEEEETEPDKDAKAPENASVMPKLATLIEISQAEVDAEIEGAKAEIDAAKAKFKAAQASMKDTIKKSKEKEKAAKAQPVDEDHEHSSSNDYTFGTGDIINNKNPNCVHYGSKGIVIQIPQSGTVRYTVTNSGDTFKPGDILTKTADQLEKI